MALPTILQPPAQRAPMVDGTGLARNDWYEFMRRLVSYIGQSGVDPAVIADILARLSELEANQLDPFEILGPLSVQVFGSPQEGPVILQLDGDTSAPGQNYYYGTGDDGLKGWFNSAGNLKVAALPGAAYDTVQKTIDTMLTPGIIRGGVLSRLDADTVRMSDGEALIATADDDGASTVVFTHFAQQDFDIPADQDTRFFALTYNGGSPVAVMQLVDDFDRDTEIPLGSAVRFNGTMVVTPNRYRTSQPITNVIQRYDAISPLQRDADVGGLTLGALAGRIATISAGRLWARLEDFEITARNSSITSMASVHYNGTNLTFTTGLTQWDNARFNNMGTGTLQAMGANKWAVLWFFLAVDGTYGFAYGTAEHNTLGGAANEGLPAYLNQDFLRQAYLVGRYVFQNGQDIPSLIEQTQAALTNISVINDHNSLANLQGGTAAEYFHLTSAEHTFLSSVATAATFDERAQDATAAMFAAGTQTGITFTYNDAAGSMSATVTGGGSGALAQIDEVVTSGSQATVSFPGIPGTYRHLELRVQARGTAAAAFAIAYVRFNGDSGNNYDSIRENRFGNTNTVAISRIEPFTVPAATAPAGTATPATISIPNYRGTTFHKSMTATSSVKEANAAANEYMNHGSGYWRNTAAITSIEISLSSGAWVDGSVFTLYGMV